MANFPSLAGRDLEWRDRRVPEDLEGSPRVLVVAFKQWHQPVVNAWVAALERDGRGRAPGMRIYEVPTISDRWNRWRDGIDGNMVRAIPDRDVRERTVTVYAPLAPILRALGLLSRRRVAVFVLADDGAIRARAVGAPTPASVRAVIDAL